MNHTRALFALALLHVSTVTLAADSDQDLQLVWIRDGRVLFGEGTGICDMGHPTRSFWTLDVWTNSEYEAECHRDIECDRTAFPLDESGARRPEADVRKAVEECVAAQKSDADRYAARRRKARGTGRGTPAVASVRSHDGTAHLELVGALPPAEGDRAPASGELYARQGVDGVRVRVVAENRPPHETRIIPASGDTVSIAAFWSPDDQWVVLLGAGSDDRVVPGRARVDLLDSGAGIMFGGVVEKLSRIGFTPDHQGTALPPRTETEVFVAAGFEADGRRIADELGLKPEAVKPLTWDSPYAITVAVGSSYLP